MSHQTTNAAPPVAAAKATLSIRARLMVLAAIVLVPLLVDRIRTIENDRVERINAANQQVLALARQGVAAQRDGVLVARAFLQVAARAQATLAPTSEACNRFFTDIAAQASWKMFSVADGDGRIVCSSRAEAIGLDISDRLYFQEAVRSGQFVVSDYARSRVNSAPTSVALLPQIGSDGTVESVLIGALNSDWITRLASTAAEYPRSAIVVVNGAGVILAHHPEPERWSGRDFNEHPLVRAMLSRPDGVAMENGLDGVRRVFGFAQLPGTETRLAIGLDEQEIVQGVDREMRYAYLQLAAIAMMLLVAIWVGGNRFIVRPIRLLALLAERFGHGEYEMHTARRRWAAEFLPLVAALDDMAAKVIARRAEARIMTERLNELATKDQLSGLANRRAFDAALDSEWKRAQLRGEPVALAMIDADHFKLFNDHYGHVAGDSCLRAIAEVLAGAVRTDLDLAARYGGEEFALLLPGMELTEARKVAMDLRRAIEDCRIAHAKSSSGHVTVSIGVAALRPLLGEKAQVLVEAADSALYDAKRQGRNTVVAYEPMMVLMAS
jgi:diguanylate cyclase (GGDEF)-like protein